MEKKEEVINILMSFLRKATEEGATATEIASIPSVAKLILDYSDAESQSVV